MRDLSSFFKAIYDDELQQIVHLLSSADLAQEDLARLVESAIENNNPAALREFLDLGADPDGRSQDWHRSYTNRDWTHLHHAVDAEIDAEIQWGIPADLRLIRPLIEAGAHVLVATSSGELAIDMARYRSHTAAVEALAHAASEQSS